VNYPGLALVIVLLQLAAGSATYAQDEIDFKVVPGEICASIQPDINYIFKDVTNYFRLQAGPNTSITDTVISGADFTIKNGLIEIIPFPDSKKVVLNIEAKFGEFGHSRTIERVFNVCNSPEVKAGRIKCDSVIDAYTFLLCGKLDAYSKELRTALQVDSFSIQWVSEGQAKSIRMNSNKFPQEFRADMLKKRQDQPIFFSNVYGSLAEGVPIILPQCRFFITETQAPVKWSIGDE
jgi:hypothetical protein